MKRNIIRLCFGLAIAFSTSLLMSGCSAADAVTPNCTTSDNYCDSGKPLETCCTSTKCYYKWNGTKYNCNGTDCFSAAEDVVNAACSSGAVDVDDLVKLSADLVENGMN